MEIFYYPQYSPEWWEAHSKRLTASHAQAIGSNGAGLKTYVRELTRPFFSKAEKQTFSNKDTERGLELEPQADMVYCFKYGVETKEVGFVVYNDYVGCSPDRLVGNDGLTEIKCPDDKAYFNLLLDKKIESKYIWQIQMQLLITERKWCDFVAYNPNFGHFLFVKRITPEKDKFDALLKGFDAGEKMIKDIERKMAA